MSGLHRQVILETKAFFAGCGTLPNTDPIAALTQGLPPQGWLLAAAIICEHTWC